LIWGRRRRRWRVGLAEPELDAALDRLVALGYAARREQAGAVYRSVARSPRWGIAVDQLPHLFSRFYQVARTDRPSQGGLGLGLFICQELAAAHGGRIVVASTEGEGTTFTVWLPLLETAPVM